LFIENKIAVAFCHSRRTEPESWGKSWGTNPTITVASPKNPQHPLQMIMTRPLKTNMKQTVSTSDCFGWEVR